VSASDAPYPFTFTFPERKETRCRKKIAQSKGGCATMAGQIIKRGDKTWLVRIFTGRDGEGKRQYLNKTLRGTKKDAETYLNRTLTEISSGTFVEPVRETLEEYFDKWLTTAAKPRVSERTYAEYEALLKRYVRGPLGKVKLSALRSLDIQRVYSEMQERGLSARVVRYTHAVLTSSLKQAVNWGMLARNPAALVQLPKQTRKEMRALSSSEAKRFLKALEGDRYATLFSLALTTGMRPEEYLGLQWKDLDLVRGTVTVQRALVWRIKGGGWYYGEPKTSRSRRTIPLPISLSKLLIAHKRQQAAERLKLGSTWQDHGLVFTTVIGSPLNIPNLSYKHFKPALERAKLPKTIRLYDLRHTCATLLLSAGEHPKVVSERLGHAGVTLTLDVYSHVLPTMQEAASQKLERILFG
jgi:integrase